MLNISSPSPLYEEENSNANVDNSNKRNISMIHSNNPSSRPTLNNVNSSGRLASVDENMLKFEYEFKILLIGSNSVGKTSILSRYIKNDFQENYKCTIKAEYCVKIVNVNNSRQAKLNIWDTVGEEKFRAITSQYYKDSNGIFLVYDISSRESFENLDIWMEDIKNCAPENCVIILVGNKSDLVNERVVSFKEGKDKAEQYGILFNEVSAKNGDNILLIFGNISEAVLEQFEKSKTEISVDKKNSRFLDDYEFTNKREKIRKKKKKCC